MPFSTEEGVFLQCLASLLTPRPLVAGVACVAPDGSVPATRVTALATNGGTAALPYRSVFENRGDNDAYSVFADVTFIPAPVLELTAGARLLIGERRSGFTAAVPNAVLSRAPLIATRIDTRGQVYTAQESYTAVLPRFNALFQVTGDLNAFAAVSKGRRSPVVQLGARRLSDRSPAPNLQLVPEEVVWNYEAGVKLASPLVSSSLGVYYQKNEGFQVSVVQPNGTTVTQSAGAASSLGVEAEVNVSPTPWLEVFGNVGYIDGGIDEDNSFAPQFSGARFRLQPEWQAAGFTIDAPLGNGMRVFATPSVTYRSRIFFELPNNPLLSQDAVTLLNARAGISFADDRSEVAGFIRNAMDEDYLLDAGNTGGAFGIPTFIPAEPRFYGIQLTARIGD